MAGDVLCDVLSLAVLEIVGLHDDASAARTGVLAMGPRIFDADHDLMGDVALLQWFSLGSDISDISDNYRPIAHPELRAMTIANLKTFLKAERLT